MKRVLDISIALIVLILCAVLFLVIIVAIKLSSKGPVLYWSSRVGQYNSIFRMPKFRSMHVDTPVVATDILENPNNWLTPIGSFLRRTSLDELPQIFSILTGDMSFVGPRPALFNQYDLTHQRTKFGVHFLVPGLTGWAQVNGRDEVEIDIKVALDCYYLEHHNIFFDIKILWLTLLKVGMQNGVSH